MKKLFRKEMYNFTLYGALFGLLFPLAGTLIQSYMTFGSIHLTCLLKTQQQFSLLWIIDTAPFWLGLFALFGGIQLDKVNVYKDALEIDVKEKVVQLHDEIEKQKELIIEKADALLETEDVKNN